MKGERLAEIRKDHGDRQSDLAEKLNVSRSTVRSWEGEDSSPSHELLVAICRLYHVSSDYLLGLSDIDPAYIRRKAETLSIEDQALIRDMEEFLLWRSRKAAKDKDLTEDP